MNGMASGPHEKEPPLLLPVIEAGRLLSISRDSVYELIARGQLRAGKIGTRTVIHRHEVERFAARVAGGGHRGDQDS